MKSGDWVYHDFELGQLRKSSGGYLEFSTGIICSSGQSILDYSFPLSMRIKTISDTYSSYLDQLHKEGNNALNFPCIHSWLCEHWKETCATNKDTKEFYEERYGELRDFVREILDQVRDFKFKYVKGVRVGR